MLYIIPDPKLLNALEKLCTSRVSIGCQLFENVDLPYWFEVDDHEIRASSKEALEWLFRKGVYELV